MSDHVPTDKTAPGYIRIVKRGCGGFRNDYTGEYDCSHDYPWTCDDCPVVTERYEFVGPPSRPVSFREYIEWRHG